MKNETKWNTYGGREVVNDSTGNVMFEAETPQDANLIASAPEMLEALIETLACIDQHTDDEVLGPIIESAQQAIKKAKGGA